jgi:F-type H+-transporting ATPase subunit delta
MTERTTLARPYAEAAFRLASERKALKPWSDMLRLATAVAGDPQIAALADNPQVTRARFIELFLDVCGKKLDRDGANFVRLLHENRRLALLPEIAALYEERRAQAENRVEAEVVSAFQVSESQLKAIAAALKQRLGRDIDLTTRIDTSLVGGIVVRAGDLVIDGSVQGKLQALATYLNR